MLRTRVVVELQDELKLFDSTDADAYTQLGIKLNEEFKHYWVHVGSILTFKEMGDTFTSGHEVVHIETVTYPKMQDEYSEGAFNLMIVYYVKRLTY
ncbi:hypothetical protein [Spirosoma aerophilum]